MTNNTYKFRPLMAFFTSPAPCQLLLVGALSLTCTSALAAEYYRWTDEKGVVHMTDKRPEDRADIEVVKPPPPVPKPLKQQAKEAEEVADAEAEALAEEEALEKAAPIDVDINAPRELRCQQEKERLSILKSNSVVHMQDANGNLKTLSDTQVQKEIALTQKAIAALCD